ncbi:MAG: hypothetical protein ACOC1G_04635, partial [Phycisphaeraceae bacterium]
MNRRPTSFFAYIGTTLLLGFASLAFVCTLAGAPASAASVWREGENPDAARVIKHNWYNRVQKDMLSGEGWLSHYGNRPGSATYEIDIPEAGQYTLWVRANPVKAKLSWRLDGGKWHTAPTDLAKHRRNIAPGSEIDMRFVAWLKLGRRDLDAGTHRLDFAMRSEISNHGAIDAIYLTTEGIEPVGKDNPATAGDQHAPGFFPWSPGTDPLDGTSPIDLRHLNEDTAGEHGFVRRDGDRLALANGDTVRFWSVQGGMGNDPELYDRRARRLAKYGVNLVRMGGGHFFRDWRNDKPAFRDHLDDLHRRVAALKKHGVYTYLDHLYWHTHHDIDDSVFPGFGDGGKAIALIFFSDEFQDLYLDFLREMMTTPNPHTDEAMADDPAVAFLEIHNETGLLFWTFKPEDFPEPERELVERKFGQWLMAKYGSLEQAREAWGNNPRKGNPTPDAFADGRVGLYASAMLTGNDWAVGGRNHDRASDQLAFMVESQKRFYERMSRELKEDVGVGQLIAPSNWKSADPRLLDGLERYTYTGADVVCRNTYFGTQHAEGGNQRFFRVEVGDTYRDRSSLRGDARPTPLGTPQIAGYPFLITENNWTRPNRYRVEWPMLVATYASLQGIDGWTFFAKEGTDWRHTMGVWDLGNPSVQGQFPAAALIYRRGDVTEPEQPAVHERVSLNAAYHFQGTAAVPLRGSDAMWEARIGDRESAADASGGTSGTGRVSPLAYFVGPVVQSFLKGEDDSNVSIVERADNFETVIDPERRIVRSMTDELTWNADAGVMTVDTPTAQGAWGFLRDAGSIELGDVTIRSGNRYASVVAVSLDGRPLAESKRILIQTGTWDRPFGFTTEPAGEYRRITHLGGYPLNVRRVDATV